MAASMRTLGAGLACSLLLVGIGCARTRLPQLEGASTEVSRRSAEDFYPYGEESAGPVLNAQPRNYDLPRSEATRLQRTPLATPTLLP